jgi:hypothetical protein
LVGQSTRPTSPYAASNPEPPNIRHGDCLDKKRNAIAHGRGRVKDFWGIGMRYDNHARIFLAATCLVAVVACWH